MYKLVVLVNDIERQGRFVRMLQASPDAAWFDVFAMAAPSELEGYLAAGERLDVLVVDTVLEAEGGSPDGVELAQRCLTEDGGATQLVYLTEHAEHVTRACRTPFSYFLVDAPVDQQDVDAAVHAVVDSLCTRANRPLCVRCDGRVQAVAPDAIYYIESDRRKLHIHLADEVLTVYATLDSVARELPATFVRSHKSFLVNMRSIESVEASHIRLRNGGVVPVSQKRRKATHDAFVAFLTSGV